MIGLTIAFGMVVWGVVAIGVSILIGRMIERRDRQIPRR